MDEKIKAQLVVRLLANDVVIAESDDAALWERTFRAIRTGDLSQGPSSAREDNGNERKDEEKAPVDAIAKLAKELGVKHADVQAALAPTTESPFVHIDSRYWEAFKKASPSKGPGAVAPTRAVATAMVLWFRAADLGSPTRAQVSAAVAAAHLTDDKPGRSLGRTNWLQVRGENVILNPAAISEAEEFLRAFCEKRPPERQTMPRPRRPKKGTRQPSKA